jgi:pimeloyl-ACP methyl ester carboxylesterase
MSSAIQPFTVAVPDSELEYLHRRIDLTRWPEQETVDDWSQGVPLAALHDLVSYWRDGYDWRWCERELNRFGKYATEIDGLRIHFVHVRSSNPDALPLILTHGWPGSVREFFDVFGPLTDAGADLPFHVVAPSLPGFGFSGKPGAPGWGVERIARAWAELMRRLGYTRWVAQGGDWGAAVTTQIGVQAPDGCAGIHVNMPVARPTAEDLANPSPEELKALAALQHYQEWDSGYSKEQSTRPQTLGYALVDSPVGLAAWIFEKMWAWTDNQGSPFDALGRDAILDNIMLYWLPGTGASSARLYWESFAKMAEGTVATSTGVTQFPKEIIPAPRKWAERRYTNLVYWNEADKGGHFAAWEQPELFVNELRRCFGEMLR